MLARVRTPSSTVRERDREIYHFKRNDGCLVSNGE
jgi:hypothetical protein